MSRHVGNRTDVIGRVRVHRAREAGLGVVVHHLVGRAVVNDLTALQDHQIVEEVENLSGRLHGWRGGVC
jgi:hypothetical protein